MRLVQKSDNGPSVTKGTAELNKHIEAEKRGGRGGVAGEGQWLSEEDELRIIEDGEDANSRRSLSSVQLPVEAHGPHPQVQSQARVCWDRFLPAGSPKVLLVENDDSTCHIVTALLRNCSYEVVAVSNGIEAWKILEDLNNQIDLVLTEVVMPGLSGIGLLSKIMSHKSCQNVPVIMMSSHDSMGIVLKCLSKGAADFLLKPIRKNELKNLWQHVWRRCHSSSGSASESCIRNEKSVGPKYAEESDNDTDSNDEDENISIGLQARDGSDNGSGTQSSWTKRAAEVESPQRPSSWDNDPPDSTCAQVIYPMPEAFASSWMPVAPEEHDGQDNKLDNVSMGKDLKIRVPKSADSQLNGPNRKVNLVEKNKSSQLDLNLKNDGQNFDEEILKMSSDKRKGEWIKHAKKPPGEAVSNDEYRRERIVSDAPPPSSEISNGKDKVKQLVEDLPSLELSLKRLGDVAYTSTNLSEQNIVRQSQLSAFTRYDMGSNGNQGQNGNIGSCSPPNNSSEAAKQSNSDPPNQILNSSSNNNNMDSTTNMSSTKPILVNDKAPTKSTVNFSHHAGLPKENDVSTEQHKIQHHHHYHHHHNLHSARKQQKVPAQEDMSKSMDGTTPPQSGSSNTCKAPTKADVGNGSLNGSGCGSNHGSNFINGSSAVVNADMTNTVTDSEITAKDGVDNGSGSGSGSGSGVGVDQSRLVQREAALNKFRQKRKERCFDKKVRYQSRKKLADQRPRVRGQFVRQVQENNGKNADS
ncbi:two-component response regulator-like PRR73 isoform X2 [Amaranthus tricolor]|uniref:two-component response regulator-like PRR73 isoform X2 n=1 Tax=Amaranthus tricolor TaxID=29722 RepID=UPI002588C13C|nr:two-component response regulator-like PRR73 isoform X2 [Amaranthus tricolor]